MEGLLLRTTCSRRVFLTKRKYNIPFYRRPVLQRGYGLGSIFKSVAGSVMPSLKEIGESALRSIARCGKGQKYQNSSKERSERKQSSIFG